LSAQPHKKVLDGLLNLLTDAADNQTKREIVEGVMSFIQAQADEKAWSDDARAIAVTFLARTDPKQVDAGFTPVLLAASVQIADGLAEARRVRQGKAATGKVDAELAVRGR